MRHFFLRGVKPINAPHIPQNRPILFASNHSGSFFDALIIGGALDVLIHTLTRGDVFKNPKVAYWLRQINLIPTYRGSEGGREHLLKNSETFKEVHKVFIKNEAVVVFSEGICVNEWNLRPLAKGTARIAWQEWYGEGGLRNMIVIPTGVTYEHFRGFGKRIKLQFGEPILPSSITTAPTNPEKWVREFNQLLEPRMRATILETFDGKDHGEVKDYFSDMPLPKGGWVSNALGRLGRSIHSPFVSRLEDFVAKKTKGTVFYDSVLFGLALYIYPVFILSVSLMLWAIFGFRWGLGFFLLMPALAWFGNWYR